MKAYVRNNLARVRAAARRANFENVRHAAAVVMRIAKSFIRRARTPSQEGQPPHTQTLRLKKAIQFAADNRTNYAIIGPTAEIVGPAGKAHEYGGLFRGRRYPRRRFMGPALEEVEPRLAQFWANTIR